MTKFDPNVSPPLKKPLRTFADAWADRERTRDLRRQQGICPHCGIIDRPVIDEHGLCEQCYTATQNGVDEKVVDLDASDIRAWGGTP